MPLPTNIVYSLAHPPPSLTSVLIKLADSQKKLAEVVTANQNEKIEIVKKDNNESKTDIDEDPILEMIELTEGIEDKKDAKRGKIKNYSFIMLLQNYHSFVLK